MQPSDPQSEFAVIVDPAAPCIDFPPSEWSAVGAALFPFALDLFQQHAVCAISRGENLLVTAKTGSGKTAVAEYQIAHSLAAGGRVFYTTPIKSLSNQKFSELKAKFKGFSVGILTGDVKFSPDAQIVVMTQEILRNRLFKVGTATAALGVSADLSLGGLHAVVFDEAHYMFDPERGHAWEETLMLLPPDVRCVLLTATLASPIALCGWLGDVRRVRTTLLSTAFRAVPLVHGVLDSRSGDVRVICEETKGFDDKGYRDWIKTRSAAAKDAESLRKKVAAAADSASRAAITSEAKAGNGGEKPKAHSFTHELNAALRNLESKELLPALFFVLSRKGCEDYAARLEGSLLDTSDAAAVRHIFDFHLHRHKAVLETLTQYHAIRDLVVRGIAFHHSGVLPALKEVVELLFSRGMIKALFATETFAVGLNMPTKTAVFLDVRKFDDALDGMRALRPDEYAQMAGRAGRRGMDTRGIALYLPAHPPLEPGDMKKMVAGSLAPLHSKLLLHYDFVLRVLQTGRVAFDLLLGRSFWQRQQGDMLRALELDLSVLEAKRVALPLTDAQRGECGVRAAVEFELIAAMNAARKAPQRELEKWKNTHVGPKWEAAWTAFVLDGKLASEESATIEYIRRYRLPVSQTRLAPVVAVLRALGFIKEANATDDDTDTDNGIANDPDALARLSSSDLTLKGVLATEVNEGNAILLPELYMSGLLRGASAEEVVGALGFFIEDREAEKNSIDVDELDFPPLVRDAAELLGKAAARAVAAEDAAGVVSEPGFYTLRTLWADVGIRWMRGAGAREICDEYGMFEGNLLRGLGKLSNLLTVWISLATYCEHVEVLDKLRDSSALLLRDIACIESLYLRL